MNSYSNSSQYLNLIDLHRHYESQDWENEDLEDDSRDEITARMDHNEFPGVNS